MESLHHLDRLHRMHGINGDGKLGDIAVGVGGRNSKLRSIAVLLGRSVVTGVFGEPLNICVYIYGRCERRQIKKSVSFRSDL